MKIKYLGPSDSVNVGGFGSQSKYEEKEYPDDVGAELLATSKKQRFEAVDEYGIIATGPIPEKMTVAQLMDLLAKLDVEVPAGAKKGDLVALVNEHTAPPLVEE